MRKGNICSSPLKSVWQVIGLNERENNVIIVNIFHLMSLKGRIASMRVLKLSSTPHPAAVLVTCPSLAMLPLLPLNHRPRLHGPPSFRLVGGLEDHRIVFHLLNGYTKKIMHSMVAAPALHSLFSERASKT